MRAARSVIRAPDACRAGHLDRRPGRNAGRGRCRCGGRRRAGRTACRPRPAVAVGDKAVVDRHHDQPIPTAHRPRVAVRIRADPEVGAPHRRAGAQVDRDQTRRVVDAELANHGVGVPARRDRALRRGSERPPRRAVRARCDQAERGPEDPEPAGECRLAVVAAVVVDVGPGRLPGGGIEDLERPRLREQPAVVKHGGRPAAARVAGVVVPEHLAGATAQCVGLAAAEPDVHPLRVHRRRTVSRGERRRGPQHAAVRRAHGCDLRSRLVDERVDRPAVGHDVRDAVVGLEVSRPQPRAGIGRERGDPRALRGKDPAAVIGDPRRGRHDRPQVRSRTRIDRGQLDRAGGVGADEDHAPVGDQHIRFHTAEADVPPDRERRAHRTVGQLAVVLRVRHPRRARVRRQRRPGKDREEHHSEHNAAHDTRGLPTGDANHVCCHAGLTKCGSAASTSSG